MGQNTVSSNQATVSAEVGSKLYLQPA